jgi:hypothetical protein
LFILSPDVIKGEHSLPEAKLDPITVFVIPCLKIASAVLFIIQGKERSACVRREGKAIQGLLRNKLDKWRSIG